MNATTSPTPYPAIQLFINGAWLQSTSSGTLPVFNPANGESIGECPVAGEA